MNINLLKTFLEVARQKHFGKAADKICLTQSAVSARIKQIEEALGVTLLIRKRNDIQLTPEGRRLAIAAENIVKQWELAKSELSLTRNEGQQLVRLGLTYDIWSILPSSWLVAQRQQNPAILFQLQSYSSSLLQERLLADEVDAAILFDPPYHPGLEIIDVGNIQLQLLATYQATLENLKGNDYVYVDWGESFSSLHQQQLGDVLVPAISMNISSMAIDYLNHNSGMAYLSQQQIHSLPKGLKLYEVEGAPRFERGIFYVYRKSHPLADILNSIIPSLQ